MAFLRVEKKKSGTYIRIIKSYRENGKKFNKTLYSLGKVEDYSPEQLINIGKKFLNLAGCPVANIEILDLQELGRYNYGYTQIVNRLWNKYELNKFIKINSISRRYKFDIQNVIKLMLAERLNIPVSKLSNYNNQTEYIGFKEVKLQWLYRSLDFLNDTEQELQKHLFDVQQTLFSQTLDIVFYDVTTLYFDVTLAKNDDDIRQKGYSKDGKARKLQVVLGLLVDKNRNPVSYRIYQGGKYEGHTFIDAVNELRNSYKIDKITIVADSGMLNGDNIKLVLEAGYDYIVGERLKSMSKKSKNYLTNRENYIKFTEDQLDEKQTIYEYTTTTYKQRNIICTYSEKRARKDKAERERLLAKAKKYIENQSLLKNHNKQGAKRYIDYQSETKFILDEEKIKDDEKYDGYKAIATSLPLSDVETILNQYYNLFEVEHAFRTMKSHLEIRPAFHWTEKRIRGHIAMCFIAYSFLNNIRTSLNWSEQKIFTTLNKMQVSEVKQKSQRTKIYLRAATTDDVKKLQNAYKLSKLGDTIPINQLDSLL